MRTGAVTWQSCAFAPALVLAKGCESEDEGRAAPPSGTFQPGGNFLSGPSLAHGAFSMCLWLLMASEKR